MRRALRSSVSIALFIAAVLAGGVPSVRAAPNISAIALNTASIAPARQSSPPSSFKWSVQEILPTVPVPADGATVPGFYCASCGSDRCRQVCTATGVAVGMQNRFLLCELMPAENVYDLGSVRSWVEANAAAGLRSIIGFTFKTSRGYNAPNSGSCTPASDGTPAWMLQPASVYQPLQNGTGAETTYHLNYRNAAVQSQLRGLMRALRQEFAAMPPELLATVDSVEVDVGHNGELTPARNYDSFPAGAPLGWMDRNMYRCVYAGYAWYPARTEQFCTDPTGAIVDTTRVYGAADVWRDDVVKPIVDLYGQELSRVTRPSPTAKPLILIVTGQILTADERVDPCAGCSGLNIIDYAHGTYDMGIKTSGVNPDTGNGNGPDTLNAEYRNWPNIFTLNWPGWLAVGEHGVNSFGGGHCCDDERELYWAVLNGLDKHMSQLHFLASDIGQPGAGAEAARRLFVRYAGRTVVDTPDVWIVFRDSQGTYYPDGDNGQPQGNPPGRVPCCRALPNYEWFLYQRNPAPSQVVRTGLPDAYQSLSARSDSQGPLQLDVEDLWFSSKQYAEVACSAYDVEVEFLDSGNDSFVLRYAQQAGSIVDWPVQKTGTGQWRTVTLRLSTASFNNGLSDGADLELVDPDGSPDVFHRLRVEMVSACDGPQFP